MLTKSKFKNYLKCPNEFWLDHHFPEPADEVSLQSQFRRESGYEVERLARSLTIFQAIDGRKVEFGKVFEFGQFYAKADVVVTDILSGTIDIYEVKSGAKVKDEYQIDVAFQCLVAEKSGFTVANAFVVTINNSYVFDGELDVEKLFNISNETEFFCQQRSQIESDAQAAIDSLKQAERIPRLTDYCKGEKLKCRAIRRHFPEIPNYNVSNIFNAGSKKLNALLDAGILKIDEIPHDFSLTDREALIVAVERSQTAYLDLDSIADELGGLQFPLNFLDYESFNPAVPKFHSTVPYQQMVFQYSLHTLDNPNAELRHSFHLSRNDGRHPAEEIVERLFEDLNGKMGTVIVWSDGFEKTRNREMGEMFPQYAEFLGQLDDAVYDLRKIFSRRLYMRPEFRGKDSIKKVLPVLSDLTYQGMDIADGLTASILWYHAATQRGTADEREKIFRDLEAYCYQDTLAMVAVYRHLVSLQ